MTTMIKCPHCNKEFLPDDSGRSWELGRHIQEDHVVIQTEEFEGVTAYEVQPGEHGIDQRRLLSAMSELSKMCPGRSYTLVPIKYREGTLWNMVVIMN